MQGCKSEILHVAADALCYVSNYTVLTDFKMPYVSEVIHEWSSGHHTKFKLLVLNPLLEQ